MSTREEEFKTTCTSQFEILSTSIQNLQDSTKGKFPPSNSIIMRQFSMNVSQTCTSTPDYDAL